MHGGFPKLAKFILLINMVLNILILGRHGYNLGRMIQTQNLIESYMAEQKVTRNTAIYSLEKSGEDLLIGGEFHTLLGINLALAAVVVGYFYLKNGRAFLGLILAILSLFTSFIGGLALFYLLFTGKYDKRISG